MAQGFNKNTEHGVGLYANAPRTPAVQRAVDVMIATGKAWAVDHAALKVAGRLVVENTQHTALAKDPAFTAVFGTGVTTPGCAYGLESGKGYRFFSVPPLSQEEWGLRTVQDCPVCKVRGQHSKAFCPARGSSRQRVAASDEGTTGAARNRMPAELSGHVARVMVRA